MGKIKKALQPEIEAIKNGELSPAAEDTLAKKAGGRKRKNLEDDNEGTPKKRGRTKKNAVKEETESPVKDEPEDDNKGSVDAEV
jgi:hypothetical protein